MSGPYRFQQGVRQKCSPRKKICYHLVKERIKEILKRIFERNEMAIDEIGFNQNHTKGGF
jgi:REP element-mobilizing transposase RayT